jgi:hypothetical protein
MSARASTVLPISCSGAMYAGVPMTSPSPVSRVLTLSMRAMPKSTTFTASVRVISTFSGFRSRWIDSRVVCGAQAP